MKNDGLTGHVATNSAEDFTYITNKQFKQMSKKYNKIKNKNVILTTHDDKIPRYESNTIHIPEYQDEILYSVTHKWLLKD